MNKLKKWISEIADIKNWDPQIPGEEEIPCYVSKIDGSYITFVSLLSDVKWMFDKGIIEQIQSTHPEKKGTGTSQIGFNPKENKWYGWSHRAVFGFGIGSEVKKGDVGFNNHPHGKWKAENLEDAKQMAINFAKGVS